MCVVKGQSGSHMYTFYFFRVRRCGLLIDVVSLFYCPIQHQSVLWLHESKAWPCYLQQPSYNKPTVKRLTLLHTIIL